MLAARFYPTLQAEQEGVCECETSLVPIVGLRLKEKIIVLSGGGATQRNPASGNTNKPQQEETQKLTNKNYILLLDRQRSDPNTQSC